MVRIMLVMLFAIGFTAPTLADNSGQNAFVGAWTFNSERSEIAENDLTFMLMPDGRLHSEGGGTAPYDFKIDGGAARTANGRIMEWKSQPGAGWIMTKTREGKIVETTRVTLSADQRTLVTAGSGSLPDGSDFKRTTTYRRVSGKTGLPGRWHSVKVDTGATWDGYIISQQASGIMVWEIPTDHQVITGRFDGSDLPITGPGLPADATIAVRQEAERKVSVTKKVKGTISESGTITISPDGQTMTELSWPPGQADRKSKAIYVRTPRKEMGR
jgi:hypothetical protein